MAASLTLRLPGKAQPADHRKATIRSVDGRLAMTIPIVDPETDFSELGQEWATIDRFPLVGVTYRRGPKLARATLRMRFIAEDRDQSIAHEVLALKAMCDSLSAVVLSYGALEAKMSRSGAWVITGGGVNVLQRVQGSNDPRWAEATLELLEFADFLDQQFVVPAGLLASGARVTASGGRTPATHIWRSGDSLYALALQIYGDAAMWTKIGDANKVRDPAAIPVGTVLKLP